MARKITIKSSGTAQKWDRRGVCKKSLRSWARLNVIARHNDFDEGMVVEEHLWTPEFWIKAFHESGRSRREWASAAGLPMHSLDHYVKVIGRVAAWRLSRAATVLGVSLPPVGIVQRGNRNVSFSGRA